MRHKFRLLHAVALLVLLNLFFSCAEKQDVNILPMPVQVDPQGGTLVLDESSKIILNELPIESLGVQTQEFIKKHTGLDLQIEQGKVEATAKDIQFCLVSESENGKEGYTLDVNGKGVTIQSESAAGLFYGAQSLRQLLPLEPVAEVKLPKVHIVDYPRFGWRGLHLDVSRHFFTVDEVKRFIDLMAMYKFNTFHWHLTDDQGWRIEIKKYPLLTSKGAWRERVGFEENQKIGLNEDNGKPYGGFYTQEEIKDVVRYAGERHITIIPEIDVPGHSVAAIHAYPHLCCFPNEAAPVRLTGGVSDGVYCAGKESSFTFITDVLDEVMELFPSKRIHVGGDEAPKRNWRRCPLCQDRIKKEGLKDEQELQSYFISRIAKHLQAHGRELLGWDEIMEGKSVEGATIMSWRGVIPGMEAARAGHEVIMTPAIYTYLNILQSINPVTQQSADGAVLNMRKLYEFNPAPEELEEEYRKNIIGVQACQWSEGTPNQRILDYKEYPRAIAMSEVAWSQQDKREWTDFYQRLNKHLPFLTAYGVGYGAPCYDVTMNVLPSDELGTIKIAFKTDVPDSIYYTLDGTEPTKESKYTFDAVLLTEPATVKACMFRPDGSKGRVVSKEVSFHKAIAKKVTYNLDYSVVHDGGGDFGLVDGIFNQWQGFEKSDADFVVDMGEVMPLTQIQTRWFYDIGDWVFRPLSVTYEVSEDGEKYTQIHEENFENPANKYEKGILEVKKDMTEQPVRFIRVKAKSPMKNPSWHHNAGGACWIFVDEVVVK